MAGIFVVEWSNCEWNSLFSHFHKLRFSYICILCIEQTHCPFLPHPVFFSYHITTFPLQLLVFIFFIAHWAHFFVNFSVCECGVCVCDVYPYLCTSWLEEDIVCPAVFLFTYSLEIVNVTELGGMFVTSKLWSSPLLSL